MTNEEKILSILETMRQDIADLKEGQERLEEGQAEIKSELRYVWEDIKKIDIRLDTQDNEIYTLKRIR